MSALNLLPQVLRLADRSGRGVKRELPHGLHFATADQMALRRGGL
jgi:hypothetical protein